MSTSTVESAVPTLDSATNAPAPGRPRRSWWAFVLNVVLSSAFHGFVGIAVLLLMYEHACAAPPVGGAGDEGENGRGGSGGQTVEISIQGPEVEHPAPIVPGQAAPPEPPETPTPEPQPDRPNDPDAIPIAHNETPRSTHARRATAERQATGGGTGAQITSGGERAGSIGHQRALLPAAQACADPVAGVWRALKYDPLWGDWFHVTARIHHNSDDSLTGSIVARMWDGGPNDTHPPACTLDGFDFTVDMPGEGQVSGRRVTFGANTWRLRGFHCNALMRPVDYRPDHFTGVIDPAIQEFQSVNNDGGRAINDPMVFRRVACLEGDAVDPGAGAGGSPPFVERGSEPATPTVAPPTPALDPTPSPTHAPSTPEPREMLGPVPHFQ